MNGENGVIEWYIYMDLVNMQLMQSKYYGLRGGIGRQKEEKGGLVGGLINICVQMLDDLVYQVLSGTELTKNKCYQGEIKYDEVVKVVK